MAMFGGGGFAGDANQFAGGGFLPSQQDPYAAGGAAGAEGGRKGTNDSLRAVTIRHLLQSMASRRGDAIIMDGQELGNIKLIGKIVDVRDGNSWCYMTIHDGTGSIEIKHFLDDTDWQLENKRATWTAGTYIAAHGAVHSKDDKATVQAFNIRVVHDHNELTFHFLQAIYANVHFTKGQPQQQQGAGAWGGAAQQPAAGGFGGGRPAQAGGFGGGNQPAGGGLQGGPNTSGLDPCSAAIAHALAAPDAAHSENGLHTNEVVQRLQGKYSFNQVHNALNAMANEGVVFNTTGDDHWKLAST